MSTTAVGSFDVVLCFFGLVKNVTETQVKALQERVVQPLVQAGAQTVKAVLHTHRVDKITNPRNKEKDISLHQAKSVELLSRALTFVDVKVTDLEQCKQRVGDVDPYLVRGDPWPDNPRVSLTFYLRQLDSLYNVHEMIKSCVQDGRVSADAMFVLLRPDVMFTKALRVADISRFLTIHTQSANPRTILVPDFHRWGGENDRFAIAGLDVTLLYTARFDGLADYVNVHGEKPHAEKYLAHVLHAHGIHVVHAPVRFCRIRAHGRYNIRRP
jgi:hypothetical protein